MLIVTTKISKKKLLCSAIILCTVIIGGIGIFQSTLDVEATQGILTTAKIKTAEERVEFLSELGLTVEPVPLEVLNVVIPQEFDEVYTAYNELQKDCGYNLEKYKGKEVELFKFRVLDHPSGELEVYVNLLIYKNKVIGGDISSAKLDGFVTGLTAYEE